MPPHDCPLRPKAYRLTPLIQSEKKTADFPVTEDINSSRDDAA